MGIKTGTHIGPYRIEGPIGAGGMGEVYKARDTKLDRDVAIKVLPEAFANDKERLARFEREAKLLASLNHPNIAGIYGFESGGLVLELVEGPTLAERIREGRIPVEEAVAIAKQIADALAAGHEAGVIHRDLKPANIKLKEDGTVKVLDYGLAKAFEDPAAAGVDSELSQSPTLTRQGTQVGVILGTAAYMSPEQAKGKRVDKRTDVWAFGAVAYEMLTGKRAFEGNDVSDTLAAVLRAEPDLEQLPRETPASFRRAIELCLTKDAKERVHDITDVRLAMKGAFETVSETAAPVGSTRRALPWLTAIVASIFTALAVWSLMRTEPPAVTRFSYELPAGHTLRANGRAVLAVSPDGRRFAYNSSEGVAVREMEQLDSRLLPGTEEPLMHVVFSPDGRSIAYFQDGQLKRLALGGGAPVVICPARNPAGAQWASDETIFFAVAEGIMRVSANGGTPELIIPAADGERLDAPQWLPESDAVLFSAVHGGLAPQWDDAKIVAASLSSGERTVLLEGGSDAFYVRSGHLIYALGDGLLAVRFDAKGLRLLSGPVSMVEGVVRAGNASSANYAVSEDGTLFFLDDVATSHPLSWVDRSGSVDVIETIPPNDYLYPRLSPGGDRVLVIADGDARVYDLASGRESRLTNDGATTYIGWTPSGDDVAFTSATASGIEVFMRPADGSGDARQLTTMGGRVDFETWAPDGRTFAAHEHTDAGIKVLMFAFVDGEAEPATWLDEHASSGVVFSPDGRYVAYASWETGQREIYIRPFPGPGGQTTVSVGGGVEPAWASNGELFYRRTSDYRMMVVKVATDPVLTVGPPVELFPGSGSAGAGVAAARYSVTPDGQRFLMSVGKAPSGEAGPRPKVVVVQNWIEELKARVPY